ncbi:DUF4181 domain-containing protein [Bacillus sp. S/N-304-OC-R1]|uniref:DUF4181 domain-containing protein n=1 Tax=Bacillus sp. S/N-304-OC-R1 TaxID=2758034 RepID=UPI001C8D2730|nr:DUF4181 domain-containing protein [Bacillus sp. S/N-304-OC-R1]MBY0121564.1 DUF4181 domain-containing protein [Bacillus sp. S/N-304-OC-R1]
MRFIVLGAFIIILLFIIERVMNKLLGVKKKKISETTGKNIDIWRRGIILVIFLCSYPFAINIHLNIKLLFIPYAILLIGSEAFMEWKYIKNSKQFITTLTLLIFVIIFIFNIEFLYNLVQS